MNNAMDDMATALEALRVCGMDRFDPVRFRYIDTMAAKTRGQREAVAEVLEKKVFNALADYQRDFERAKQESALIIEQLTEQHPDAVEEVCTLFERCDFKAITRYEHQLQGHHPLTPLSQLTQQIQQSKSDAHESDARFSFDDAMQAQESNALESYAESSKASGKSHSDRAGLTSFRMYRDSWLKQNAEKILQQAINSAPQNAGPLNPEMLTIRSLIALRDLSPEYTHRLISYIDTLLWLEQTADALEEASSKRNKSKAKTKKKKRQKSD